MAHSQRWARPSPPIKSRSKNWRGSTPLVRSRRGSGWPPAIPSKAVSATPTALDGLLGNVAALRGQWDTLGIDRRHAIIRAILDHAVIGPGTPGARTLDLTRV
jgi:hypothetical protein